MKILLIDDNLEFRNLIIDKLDYNVYAAKNIEEAMLLKVNIDIILLDLHLEQYQSYLSIRKLKGHFNSLIIALSSDDHKQSKIKMYQSGACDYITKPIDIDLLTLKLQNLVKERNYSFADVVLNFDTFMLNNCIKLTKNETLILRLLITSNKLVTKKEILRNLWNYEVFVEENAINMSISRLRKKITLVSNRIIIKSIRNKGFKIEDINDKLY